MLPKKIRIIILADSKGYIRATTAAEYRYQVTNYNQRGFRPVDSFTMPIRRLGYGWFQCYRYWLSAMQLTRS